MGNDGLPDGRGCGVCDAGPYNSARFCRSVAVVFCPAALTDRVC